jgi:asparagine synthase (glutamine-hydrolysing)
MCGIAGFKGFRDDDSLKRMMNALEHRGPDDSGHYCSEIISLGHQRLSIIDLSERGHQPMENEDGSCKIVFNGEIYNFIELREDLIRKGHTFHSHTDTEVILHQYEEDGPRCVESFNGMFAFAIWDGRKNKLFLARDRLGIKPLYYYWDGSIFVFASEIKSLIQCGKVRKTLNLSAVYETLMLRYCRHPNTVIKNVYKISPGNCLVLTQGEPPKITCYWRLNTGGFANGETDPRRKFFNTLEDSVRLRLMSDVPVGIMLSGGIDSASITALASMQMESPNTFSIGFKDQKDNEFSRAELIARQFNTKHKEITVMPRHLEILPEVIWHNDEPVAGPSSMAFYLALEEAKRNATVVLFGQGADEVLAGYEEIKIQRLAQLFGSGLLKSFITKVTGGIAGLFSQDLALNRLHRYTSSLGNPAVNFYNLITIMDDREMQKLLIDNNALTETAERIKLNISNAFERVENPLEGILLFEIEGWLCEDILLRVDRMTMSRSIEGRVPFLDHRLVELLTSLPMEWKLKGMNDKHILRDTMKSLLPEEVCKRPKQRFNIPIHHFFSEDLNNLCRKLFAEKNELNETVFRREALLQLLDYNKTSSFRYILRHNKLSGQFYARQIWNILILQLWYKMYFENHSPHSVLNTIYE